MNSQSSLQWGHEFSSIVPSFIAFLKQVRPKISHSRVLLMILSGKSQGMQSHFSFAMLTLHSYLQLCFEYIFNVEFSGNSFDRTHFLSSYFINLKLSETFRDSFKYECGQNWIESVKISQFVFVSYLFPYHFLWSRRNFSVRIFTYFLVTF